MERVSSSGVSAREPVEVKNFSTFFKTGFLRVSARVQDSRIILSEKVFRHSDQSGENSPLRLIREEGLFLFGSHGKGTGARVSYCDFREP